MKILNTTIQNRTKNHRLQSTHVVPHHHTDSSGLAAFLRSLKDSEIPKDQLLFSIGTQLLEGNKNPAIKRFLREYEFEVVDIPDIPKGVFDLLGSAYQFLNSKMENLTRGIFYTGKEVALALTSDLDFRSGQLIFDPACGSGSFLFHSSASPGQLVGVDSDPIGVMIAKFNYFLKFPSAPPPQIYCADFFSWAHSNRDVKFDYIVGNPPFGANLDISDLVSDYINSGESFSYFIEYGFRFLKTGGVLRYIVPESLLNVKRHTDIRDFILDRTNLRRITRFPKKFAGVMSDMFMLELDTASGSETIFEDSGIISVERETFKKLKNHIFVPLSKSDLEILAKVNSKKSFDLSQSTFGLGVVTGNNSRVLEDFPRAGLEPIYTGKEVVKYGLLAPRKFIAFDRNSLQQVAPDEIYRAPSKLIYKTIARSLRFALDESGALSTNSANLLIPSVPGYDASTVMAMLNSDLYSFLYLKLFGAVNKIGKEHLMALPFVGITSVQRKEINRLCKAVVGGTTDEELQLYIHREIFDLTEAEIVHISSTVSAFG